MLTDYISIICYVVIMSFYIFLLIKSKGKTYKPGLRSNKIFYSVTFQTVTPESAEQGDYDSQGYYVENSYFDDFRECVEYVMQNGFCSSSSYPFTGHDWLSTVDPEHNYQTGEETYYCLHLECSSTNLRLLKYLHAKKYLI